MKPWIVGLTGKAGSGKSAAAKFLVGDYAFVQYSFADPIKRLLNERFGWTPNLWEVPGWKDRPQSCCSDRSPRDWAQWLGTEVGRNTFGENCWVESFIHWYDKEREASRSVLQVVIPDVRFENEAQCIRNYGGYIIHIERPGLQSTDTHVSENGIRFHRDDSRIVNDGPLYYLFDKLKNLLELD